MAEIWRPRHNFCAFETLSKMEDLKKNSALMKKRQSFCYPAVHILHFSIYLKNAY
jgi:hypothetical protein